MSLKVVVAPTSFKESLYAGDVATAIAGGVARVAPTADIRCIPISDGGEGFTRLLTEVTGGSLRGVTVDGPVGQPVHAYFGLLGGDRSRTAVIEVPAAAGIRLVPESHRDPLTTTTRGLGQLVT